jgi:hypothetical protein
VTSASIWNTTPNITTGVNDTFKIKVNDTAGTPTNYTVVVPQGLYTVDQLFNTIDDRIIEQGAADKEWEMFGNASNNKVEIILKSVGAELDFSVANNMSAMLGFAAVLVGPTVAANDLIVGSLTPDIVPTAAYNIGCSLVDTGIIVGNSTRKVICSIPITESSGYNIVYEPIHLIHLSCSGAKGRFIRQIDFTLLGDSLKPILTTEDWVVNFTVHWKELV